MDKLADMVCDFYIGKSYIPADKRAVCSYGFKLIFADIINFSIVMLLGAVMGKFKESVIFLVTLCSIRQFSGGFHAKTFWLCRTSMLITFACVIALSRLVKTGVCGAVVVSISNIVSVMMIAVMSPVRHPNKVLTVQQRKNNKLKAVILSSIFAAISILLIVIGRSEGITISITLAAVVILMIIGIAVQKGANSNA